VKYIKIKQLKKLKQTLLEKQTLFGKIKTKVEAMQHFLNQHLKIHQKKR